MRRPISPEARARTLRRILVVGLIVLVALVVLNIGLRMRGGDAVDTVERTDDAVTVVDALSVAAGPTRSVRGFVFDDAIGLRLCHARQTDPVACIGPFVELRDFDPASVPLEEIERDGQSFFHTPDPVTLVGTIDGMTMRVEDIAAAG